MNKRVFFLKVFMIVLLGVLVVRAGYLQLVMGNFYYQKSEDNRIQLTSISSPRGKIIDRNDNILVYNKIAYNLYLLPEALPGQITESALLKKISKLTSLEKKRLEENYQRGVNNNSSTIILKRNIDKETYVIVKENIDDLPGIIIKESPIRDYVHGDFAPHLLGYVGEINIDELKKLTSEGYDYKGGDFVGKTGLEKEYEVYLKGTPGIEKLEVNSKSEKIKSLGVKSPVPGNDLVLNLDFELQKFLEERLEEHFYHLRKISEDEEDLFPPTGAAAIVMNPNNGAVLAMSSIPKYDVRKFVEGISSDEYKKLQNDSFKPLENRPIRAEVNPGSIFKLVSGTAAVENLGINEDTVFVDNKGVYTIKDWEYRNWHEGGEGKMDFAKSIARSNNIVFYELGHKLYNKYGGDKMAWTARQYGLGSQTGIDLPGEKTGLVPDNEWKKKTRGEIWYPGNSLHLAIGQIVETTPLQLITMISSIANNGTLYQPQLVDKIINAEGEIELDIKPEVKENLPFEQKTYDILKKGMIEVTGKSYGTAFKYFKDFPITVAGKTGTAQTSITGANHGWFAGFAPAEDPEIAVLVFFEEGNSSSYTIPVAVDILENYFDINSGEETDKDN